MNEHAQNTIRMLIANLIGDEPKSHQMGINVIYADDLPVEMALEREVLGLIRLCDANNPRIPPTQQNVERLLLAGDKAHLIPGFRSLYQNFRTDDGDVTSLAFILRRVYFQRDKNLVIANSIKQLVESPDGLPEEQLRLAARLISREMPGILNLQPYDLQAAQQMWEQNQQQRNERVRQGLALGPNWPFPHLCALVPNIKPGEIATMMMKTKWGKSTMGSILAEHWGLTQGYRVLILLFETSIQSYMDRMIARNCLISTHDQRTGEPDLSHMDRTPAAADALAEWKHKIHGKEGNVQMLPCPGWGPIELETVIRAEKELAQNYGQELVVIWDYYQLINKATWANATQPYNESVEWLKTFTEQEGIYSFVLCQEKDEFVEPKEGTNIITRSQNFMRLHRTWADTEAPVYQSVPDEYGHGGVQAKDSLGNLRWYHRAGQLHSTAWLEVLRSNDDQPGSVELITEMSLFKMDERWDQQNPCPRRDR